MESKVRVYECLCVSIDLSTVLVLPRMFALLVQLPLSDSFSNLEAFVLEVVFHNFDGSNFDHTRLF